MPLFLDVHWLDDPVSVDDVTQAPRCRPARPRRRTGSAIWLDEAAGRIFCLVEAPSAEVAADVHREAHDLVAQEIYQGTEGGH